MNASCPWFFSKAVAEDQQSQPCRGHRPAGLSETRLRRLVSSFLAWPLILTALVAWGLKCGSAEASILVSAQDVGSNLVLTWSGSWNLTNYPSKTSTSSSAAYAQVFGNSTQFDFTSTPAATDDKYITTLTGNTFTASYASFVSTSNVSGDTFRMFDNGSGFSLILPANYVSGSSLSGSITFSGTSISAVFGSLLDSGSQTVFTDNAVSGNNTITIQAVPEPATPAFFAAGCLILAGFGFRQRNFGLQRRSLGQFQRA
ncbi:MAG: hypothetical protein O3C39_08080 [Planctomycetota bacterium]|nr:hypothetical protein [Planctomycetota bacterium]MDA1201629.1 hypothetical protein [Planctomycetota bacterium]